jgi:hypothetical protein
VPRAPTGVVRNSGRRTDGAVNPLSHADVNRLIGSGDPTMTPLITETLNRCSETK